MASNHENLPAIPLFDARETGLVAALEQHREKTVDLIDKSRGAFGPAAKVLSGVALPLGDYLSRRWLARADNPYRAEIEQSANILGKKGVVALNMSYEWGCTSGVFQAGAGAPRMARILDWPFPALGENMIVAHQKGPAGDFHNITWPGVAGMFTGVAKGRFAAALNQAPMRRFRTGIFIDWARNRRLLNRQRALPPAHLLRRVFETAPDYATAKKMLAEEPVSIPVIYILSGTKEGEGCVIERTEIDGAIREMKAGRVAAANHFESHLNGVGHGWMPRAVSSNGRAVCAADIPLKDFTDGFAWFRPPIANHLSRLAMAGEAADGTFALMGTDGEKPVTRVFSI